MDKRFVKAFMKEFGCDLLKQGLPLATILLLIKNFTDWI